MNALITGHTGTIGRHFPNEYKKINVNLLDVSATMGNKRTYMNSTVIHMAGIVGSQLVTDSIETSDKVNVKNTLEFAERALEYGATKFVFTSSSHVYKKSDKPIGEEDPIEPQNYYAEQKIRTEKGLEALFLNSAAELTIIRIFSVLDWDCKGFTLGGLFRKIAEGNDDLIINNSDDIRDFLTPVTISKLLQKIAIERGMNGVWNMSSGNPVTVKEAAKRMLGDLLGERLIERIQPGFSENPKIVGDNRKLQSWLYDENFTWTPGDYKEAEE